MPRLIHDRQKALFWKLSPSITKATIVLNPLRSEDEAFRLLLYVVAVFVVVLAVVLIARALF